MLRIVSNKNMNPTHVCNVGEPPYDMDYKCFQKLGARVVRADVVHPSGLQNWLLTTF